MFFEEINKPLSELSGVGPKTKAQFQNLGIFTIAQLFTHFPRAYDDRSRKISLGEARKELMDLEVADLGGLFNTEARVIAHEYFGNAKRILKIKIDDGTAQAYLICFNRDFLARQLPPGTEIFIAGRLEYNYNALQSSQFDFSIGKSADFSDILALYSLSGDLRHKAIRNAVDQALKLYGDNCSENLSASLIERYNFMPRAQAIRNIHKPKTNSDLEAAQARLIYEELFLLQISLLRAKQTRLANRRSRTTKGQANQSTIMKKVLEISKFTLTEGQISSLEAIIEDLDGEVSMSRLIQGDVGSGKTIVSFLAAAVMIERGYQVALMAPTVLLARQHAEKASELFSSLGIEVALLAGTLTAQTKRNFAQALKEGSISFVIGTHALFSEYVSYKNLGLVIIDEQHRFGVAQRQALYQKAEHPHLLSMSATPIPQTLALTLYGDMDVSVIDTKPLGRLPVETHLAKLSNAEKVYGWVDKELAKGHQAYFVYPLIDEEDNDELKSASLQIGVLQKRFSKARLGLVHSQLADDEKIKVMADFKAGELDILVATSVVEVGVDVPNATCMVIEHADLFGLAALHQLRGRVGRSSLQSYCFLVYGEELSEIGKERLKILKETTDGFLIAEKDLEIRGPGDLKGVEQSGFIKLKIANLTRDKKVLVQARKDAIEILTSDPNLIAPGNSQLSAYLSLNQTLNL